MPKPSIASNLDAARACFRWLREAYPQLSEWSYLLHLPAAATAWVGMGAQRIVHYSRNGFEVIANGQNSRQPASDDVFGDLRKLLDPAYPCFFLVSLDMRRPINDPALRLMSFLQPAVEVCFPGQPAQPRFDTARPPLNRKMP